MSEAPGLAVLVSLIDWTSDTCIQGYTGLQSLVTCLHHSSMVSDSMQSSIACVRLRDALESIWNALECISEAMAALLSVSPRQVLLSVITITSILTLQSRAWCLRGLNAVR